MNKDVVQEAVENVALIKGVIERTKRSFTAFSQIFIYWGILFIFNSMLTMYMLRNKELVTQWAHKFPVLNYMFPTAIVAVIAALIYRQIAKRVPLAGLEKQLMTIWLLIMAMNVIPARINITTAAAVDLSEVTIHVNNLSIMLFSLATALIATALFTGYKQFKYLAGAYIIITILHAYFNIQLLDGVVIQTIYVLALPFTFLYTGLYLKSQQPRGA